MGFTLGRARRGNPCQSVFKLTGSQWPSHTSVRTVRSGAKWIVMSVITLHWPLMAGTHLGLRVNVVGDGDLLLLLTLHPALS